MRRLMVVLVAVALVGCGAPESGTIVDKRFTPAHDETYTTQSCSAYGSNGQCSFYQTVYHTDHVPDTWELRLRSCKVSGDDCDEGWRKVSRFAFDEAKNGYTYDSKTRKVTAG